MFGFSECSSWAEAVCRNEAASVTVLCQNGTLSAKAPMHIATTRGSGPLRSSAPAKKFHHAAKPKANWGIAAGEGVARIHIDLFRAIKSIRKSHLAQRTIDLDARDSGRHQFMIANATRMRKGRRQLPRRLRPTRASIATTQIEKTHRIKYG